MTKFSWVLACSLVFAADASAGDPDPMTARDGVGLVAAAAEVWADDAVLVYVENDEPLDDDGRAARWGFLYRSEIRGESRAYSVREGKVVVAETLDLRFDPPMVAGSFIDSDRALGAAKKAASEFVSKHGGALTNMLLMRGVFHDDDPDATTWTLIYSAEGVPSLYVVVDAESGDVERTWRG